MAADIYLVRTFRSRVTEWFGSHGCMRLAVEVF